MTKKSGFDLASLDTISACNKPHEIEIKSVTGEPTGFFISVLGKDSDVYRGIVRGMADESLRKQATGKPSAEKLEILEARNIDALVAATVSWRFDDAPTVELRGEQLGCTPDNVRKVYTELLPVREQVSEAINDLENFMRA